MIDDEEHERINSLLGSMQQRDEAQQRMASITHLTVTAWRCATCASTTDKRRPACQVRQHSRYSHATNPAILAPCCSLLQTCCFREVASNAEQLDVPQLAWAATAGVQVLWTGWRKSSCTTGIVEGLLLAGAGA